MGATTLAEANGEHSMVPDEGHEDFTEFDTAFLISTAFPLIMTILLASAKLAEISLAKRMKQNPRLRLVSLSVMRWIFLISPNFEKYSWTSSSMISWPRPPTKIFLQSCALVLEFTRF